MTNESAVRGAKLPQLDKSIEIRRTICGICNANCNIDAYIKDGVVIKVEGCKNPVYGNGYLCARGHANRPYIYHKDRIKTPLRRVGERGAGKFEPISWDEALDEVGKRLGDCRKKYGPDAVAFYNGYSSWYKPFLRRLAYSFGTINFGSDLGLSGCSRIIAGGVAAGCTSHPDINHSGVVLMWGCNPYNKGNTIVDPVLTQKRGAKVIAIDPRVTVSTCRLADIHLQIKPGTDAVLAHGLARIFIQNDWLNKSYIEQNVSGFFDYRAYVHDFTPEVVERITGVPREQLESAARMIMMNAPMSMMISTGAIAQQRNGVQTRRAIEALAAITGFYDVRGGQIPNVRPNRIVQAFEDFSHETRVASANRTVGARKYPLWDHFIDEFQIMDFCRQVEEKKPYPVRALCSFGLNVMRFPDNHIFMETLRDLDFYVDADIFYTRATDYADIILPSTSTFEHGSLTMRGNDEIYYTPAVIEPIGEARSDLDIICALAKRIAPRDTLLCSGSEACCDDIMRRLDLSLDMVKAATEPVKVSDLPVHPGEYTAAGYRTPTRKYELKSTLMHRDGYADLPEYVAPRTDKTVREYPFLLSVGNRQTYGFHSRMNRITWIRALYPAPAVDINAEDAKALGIVDNDQVEIITALGSVKMRANTTRTVPRGMVCALSDYNEADLGAILPLDNYDECCGVPGYRTMSCQIRKG